MIVDRSSIRSSSSSDTTTITKPIFNNKDDDGGTCFSSSAEGKVRRIALKIGLGQNSSILDNICIEMKKELILY